MQGLGINGKRAPELLTSLKNPFDYTSRDGAVMTKSVSDLPTDKAYILRL
jgi:hypothetical protein